MVTFQRFAGEHRRESVSVRDFIGSGILASVASGICSSVLARDQLFVDGPARLAMASRQRPVSVTARPDGRRSRPLLPPDDRRHCPANLDAARDRVNPHVVWQAGGRRGAVVRVVRGCTDLVSHSDPASRLLDRWVRSGTTKENLDGSIRHLPRGRLRVRMARTCSPDFPTCCSTWPVWRDAPLAVVMAFSDSRDGRLVPRSRP